MTAVVLGTWCSPRAICAGRPVASQLLPDTTLVYVRIDNAKDLAARFQKTATGRMANDPNVKPLIGALYGSLLEAYQRVEEQVGVPLDKLLSIPQGEICFAVVPPAEGPPQILLWFDAGDRFLDARQLLDRLEEQLVGRGATVTTDRIGDVPFSALKLPFGQGRTIARAEYDNVICLSTDQTLLKQLLGVWLGGEKVKSLADTPHFTTIMSRCQGEPQDPPQLSWYIDPIELLRRAGRRDFSTQAGLAMLAALGVDGVQAAGGSLTFAAQQFDGIGETHLLLETPREGVVKMLALDSGEVTPEPWVPRDASAYVTMNWDVRQTYNEVVRLVNILQGEGTFQKNVLDRVRDRAKLDLEKEVIDAASGRFTLVTWIERPPRWNSQCFLVGIRLKDASASRRVAERLLAQVPPNEMTKEPFGGETIYRFQPRRQNNQPDNQLIRQPTPCVAIVGDYLLLSDSIQLMHQVIVSRSDVSQSLANELDYKLIASKISRRLGEQKAGLVTFSRPEEGLRNVYEMVNSPTIRNQLAAGAANNRALKALHDALTKHPLPPFSVLAQYMAPAGSLMVNDETGVHYTSFALRRE
jgi:hypothetical protein